MNRSSSGFSLKDAEISFVFIFTLILGFKLSTLFKPYLGYFSSYQIIHAMIAEFYLRENFSNLLTAKAFYLIHGQPAVILLFAPLNAILVALASKGFGGGIDVWGRFSNVFFSTLSVPVCYAIFLRHSKDKLMSLLAVTIFMFFPTALVLGQCFVNDNMALLFFLAGYWLILRTNRFPGISLGCFLCSISFVLRIHFLFLLPVVLHLLGRKGEWSYKKISTGAACLILLPLLWALFVYCEGPKHESLHTSLLSQMAESRRFRIDWGFFQNFPIRLGRIVLSPLGLLLTAIGVFLRLRSSEVRYFLLWLFMGLVMSLILPQKVLDHPFYLLPFLPPAAFFSAQAFLWLCSRFGFGRVRTGSFLWVFFLTALGFSIRPLYVDLPRAPAILDIAKEIREISKPDDILVVTDTLASGVLYYGKRLGWSFDPREEDGREEKARDRFLQMLKERQAAFYVIGDRKAFKEAAGFFRWISRRYPVVYEGEDAAIFDLRGD